MQCWELGRFVVGASTYRWSDGAAVTIVKRLGKTQSVAGYTDNVYQVKIAGQETPLWGGALATAFYPLSNGKVFLVRVVGTGPGKLRQLEARLHPGGTLLRFSPIEVQDSDRFGYSLKVLASDGRGLTGVQRLFRLTFSYAARDYPNGEVILLQRGSQLFLGPRVLSSRGEQSNRTYKLLFPRDPQGHSNQIQEVATLTERNEKGAVLRQNTTIKVHRWTGNRVIE